MRDLELKQVLIAFVVLLGGSTLIGYGLNQLGVGKVGIPKCEDEKTKTLIKSI